MRAARHLLNAERRLWASEGREAEGEAWRLVHGAHHDRVKAPAAVVREALALTDALEQLSRCGRADDANNLTHTSMRHAWRHTLEDHVSAERPLARLQRPVVELRRGSAGPRDGASRRCDFQRCEDPGLLQRYWAANARVLVASLHDGPQACCDELQQCLRLSLGSDFCMISSCQLEYPHLLQITLS